MWHWGIMTEGNSHDIKVFTPRKYIYIGTSCNRSDNTLTFADKNWNSTITARRLRSEAAFATWLPLCRFFLVTSRYLLVSRRINSGNTATNSLNALTVNA